MIRARGRAYNLPEAQTGIVRKLLSNLNLVPTPRIKFASGEFSLVPS